MTMSAAQQTAIAHVVANEQQLSADCSRIFHFAEPAWREYQSAAWYVAKLRDEGFTVEEGSGGMPTAFCAEWGQGDGPTIGMYAEYDAVPANCQAAVPYEAPREGLSVLAAGHTDPHSALGISGLGAVLATKAAMQQHGIAGTLRFTGEPAEKVRGSKPIHAANGYYDGLAAMLSFHPFYMLPLCNTVRWDTHCGAAYSMIFRFECDAPEQWGAADGAPIPQSHSDIRAPGANDALMLMYQNARSLRDSMLPHRGGWSVSEAILSTGQATADNLPARRAEIQYILRMPDLGMADQMAAGLLRTAQAAAAMTGCSVRQHWVSKSRPGLANHAMSDLVWGAMQTIGAPKWGDAALEIARDVQRACGIEAGQEPFLAECTQLKSPQDAEAELRWALPPEQLHSTSDDYTDMCWHAPTARFYVARPALRGGPYPAWAMNALGGIPATIDPMVQAAAKILCLSALRLLEDAEARSKAMDEFVQRTGGGIGGDTWIPPLADYPPPIHFPWPEYVETARGKDWHIPTTPLSGV